MKTLSEGIVSEDKKEKDPFVVDKPDHREIYRNEMEKRRERRAEKDARATAEAKQDFEKLLERAKERRDQTMSGTVVTDKNIPPSRKK
jgi:hypothetical protein